MKESLRSLRCQFVAEGLSFFMAWCDCCWFQASTLTQGRVPRHNETFGCEIQNLTECIKAKRTADAKGAVGLKWWLPISYQVYHISLCLQLCLQPNKSPRRAARVPLFGHSFLLFVILDTSDRSDKNNRRSCQSGISVPHLLENLELSTKHWFSWAEFIFGFLCRTDKEN